MTQHPAATKRPGKPAGVLQSVRPRERMIGGVCAGLARYWDVDPLLVRVGFGLLALAGGLGGVLYLFAWAWLLGEGDAEPLIHQQVPSSKDWPWTWVMVGLVVACLAALIMLGSMAPFGPMPAIVVAGLALWNRRRRRRLAAAAPASEVALPSSPRFDAASAAWHARLEQVYVSDQPLPELPAPQQPGPWAGSGRRATGAWNSSELTMPELTMPTFEPYAEPAAAPTAPAMRRPAKAPSGASVPARQRRRRSSWWMTLSLLFVVAVAGLVAWPLSSHAAQPRALVVAVMLAVLAAVLLVGAFTVRPRLGILIGLVTAVVLGQSLAAPHLQPVGPAGTQQYSSTATLPEQIDIRMRSDSQLDFSQLKLTEDTTIVVNVTAGQVNIIAPPSYVLDYDIRFGTLYDRDRSYGRDQSEGRLVHAGSGPVLTIKLRLTAGEVTVS